MAFALAQFLFTFLMQTLAIKRYNRRCLADFCSELFKHFLAFAQYFVAVFLSLQLLAGVLTVLPGLYWRLINRSIFGA